jgi:flagellar hook-associated protein 1 FlgK
MTNWFAGINQAASGMDAARYGLSVVSQNIANADTPGYTRQLSVQQAQDGMPTTGLFLAPTNKAWMGGVKIASTDRADDPVMDVRVRNEHARGASADTTTGVLGDIESLFPEPSDTGLSTQLSDFWSAWASVANSPGDAGTRGVLIQKAATVIGTLHSTAASLTDVVATTSGELGADLDTANTAANQLASVNAQIAAAKTIGENTNALLDQRDQLLDKLAKTVGATATFNANGTANVAVAGQALVNGTTVSALSVNSSYQVSVGGTAVTLSASSAAARVSALTTTLPGYQAQLDAVADALSSSVNAVQASGFDANGDPGVDLFTGSGAAGLALATTDGSKIAAASSPGASLDGSNALTASHLGTSATGPDNVYTQMIGDLAAASSLAQQQQATQAAVVSNVDTMKASVSGVSYDEEVTTMLTYQHAFSASSRVLTTLDDMLDTLINHTGRVGTA